jgi:hypothetical protein
LATTARKVTAQATETVRREIVHARLAVIGLKATGLDLLAATGRKAAEALVVIVIARIAKAVKGPAALAEIARKGTGQALAIGPRKAGSMATAPIGKAETSPTATVASLCRGLLAAGLITAIEETARLAGITAVAMVTAMTVGLVILAPTDPPATLAVEGNGRTAVWIRVHTSGKSALTVEPTARTGRTGRSAKVGSKRT